MNAGAKSRKKKTMPKGAVKMSESEMVKMAVLLVPILVMFVSAVIGGIIEEIGNFKNKDCFKDAEAQALLKRVKSE